jgi:MOSC domain-containing protein YiiM
MWLLHAAAILWSMSGVESVPSSRLATERGAAGQVAQISVSPGGVPKLPVERARVTRLGLEGDRQRNRRFHGGPARAVCLFSLEVIERLRAEGHPIAPGSSGENLTIAGLDWAALSPGDRFRIGDAVEIELTRHTIPCKNITASFRDGDFTRISPKLHPGESRIYARVLVEGEVATGDLVQLIR